MNRKILFMACVLLTASAITAFEWTIDMPTSGGSVQSIAVDSSDNLYAAGAFTKDITVNGETVPAKCQLSSQGDFMLFSFTSAGKIRWFQSAGGEKMSTGNCIAVYRDAVYVTGQFTDDIEFPGGKKLTGDGKGSMFIARYSSAGELIWANAAKSGGYIRADKIVTDSKGLLYAAGTFAGEYADFGAIRLEKKKGLNLFIARFSPDGAVENVIHINGGDELFMTKVQGCAIAVDREGSVYFTGSVIGEADFGGITHRTTVTKYPGGRTLDDEELFLVKYSPQGKPLWHKKIGNAGEPLDMKLDSAGNIIITGYIDGVGFPGAGEESAASIGGKNFKLVEKDDTLIPKDIFIARFDPSGELVWARSFGGYGGDEARSLDIDRHDNIIIGGFFYGKISIGPAALSSASQDKNDALVAKFSRDGKPLWAYAGGGKKWDSVNSVAADSKGTVYAGGAYEDTARFGATVLKSRGYASFFISRIK